MSKIEESLEKAPEKSKSLQHDVSCDNCKKPIVGLRFSCYHCPSYDICEKCEKVIRHDNKHIFKIIGLDGNK